jgi:hypothetical protein
LPVELRALARRFHEWFESNPADAAPYCLPVEVLRQRIPGHMSNEWSVRWIFGMVDGAEFLEFYACHRMTNDRRVRMYFNGETRSMPAPSDGQAGVLGLATTEADRALRDELKQLGLLP